MEGKKVGRPQSTVTINLNKIDEAIENVSKLCNNHKNREAVLQMCSSLQSKFSNNCSVATQTYSDCKSKSIQTDDVEVTSIQTDVDKATLLLTDMMDVTDRLPKKGNKKSGIKKGNKKSKKKQKSFADSDETYEPSS